MKRLEDVLRAAREATGDQFLAPIGRSSNDAQTVAAEPAVCPHCGGAGYVRRRVPLGHPDFGRAVPCVCVREEDQEERQSRLLRYSNLGALSRYTFETLNPRGRGASAAQGERYLRAVAAAQRFSANPKGWLVLQGASGSGKTHIAAALANDVIASGRPILFMVVPDLLDHLRRTYDPESEMPYDRLFDQVRNADLLILDDLGGQSPTPWAEEKLYQLINHRFNLELPTVFTLSRPLPELDERLRSRLSDAGLAEVLNLDRGESAMPDGDDPLELPLLREMTFAAFKYRPTGPDFDDQAARSLQQVFTVVKNWAESPEGWLVLAGDTGRGKTHLAAAIAHHQRSLGRRSVYVPVPDLLERLRGAAAAARTREMPDYLDQIRTAPFLVLDDLTVHSDTPWAQEKLFQVLNYRYNAKLTTVITVRANEELPDSLRSRLYDAKVSQFLEIRAPDYRNPDRPSPGAYRRTRATR